MINLTSKNKPIVSTFATETSQRAGGMSPPLGGVNESSYSSQNWDRLSW